MRRITKHFIPVNNHKINCIAADCADETGIRRTIRLMQCSKIAVPMTRGWLKPKIILPEEALSWSEKRRKSVLLHELAHVKRFDCLSSFVVHVVSVLYWFNPLVWVAVRKLYVECEQACDDLVLESGTKASDYANHLVEVARSLVSSKWAPSLEVAMAKKSTLEGRLLAIFNEKKPRNNIKLSTFLTVGLPAVFLLTLLVCVQPKDQTYTIETKDGVNYVHNHAPSWGDEPKVALEFVQKIGGMDAADENYIMYKISDVCRDEEGNIFILDTGDSRIQIFNAGGEYVKTFGRKGEGPGEFKNPVSLNLDRDGRMYVGDFGKYHYIILDNKGKELKRFRQEHFIQKSRLLPENKLIYGGLYQGIGMLSRYEQEEKTGYYDLFHIIDDNGNTIYSFGEMDTYEEKEADAIFVNANVPFDVDKNGNIYIAYRYRNRIEKRDAAGNILFVFDRPINFEETGYRFDFVKEAYSNSISTHVAVDKKGRVWIIAVVEQPDEWLEEWSLTKRRKVKKSAAVFEIYDSDGLLLGSLPLPEDIFLMRISENSLLIVDHDQVSVYEYKIVEK